MARASPAAGAGASSRIALSQPQCGVAHRPPPTATNVQLADTFETPRAVGIARVLDSSAFSSSWVDDDEEFARVAADVRVLDAAAAGRRRERSG